jgi:ABC-type sugar transport system ATPase subunit
MNETGTPAVDVTGLTNRYGSHLAVDDVDLTVERGEVYGFLGPNGAGKTTTLRILTGLITPSSGSLRVLGGHPGDSDVLARVGALIESPALYPFLSGHDNLRVLARYAGVARTRPGRECGVVAFGHPVQPFLRPRAGLSVIRCSMSPPGRGARWSGHRSRRMPSRSRPADSQLCAVRPAEA